MSATYDVLVIGGGPAGATCARWLAGAGAHVAVVDRAAFPRVKLCAGWLSPAIWDVLEISPRTYPRGLWEWRRCHVRHRGADHAIPCRGWFIRRYELDEYLLRASGAVLHLGVHVKQLGREGDLWTVSTPSGALRARYLVGAGGTHCPVARLLEPPRPRRAVGVQELELQAAASAIERTRLGRDGEPELLLFDDLSGYGWNVPKTDWLNVGCGVIDAPRVRDAWAHTHAHLRASGHLPDELEPELAHVKGYSYYLFHPAHLDAAARETALLAGDALGLAHPLTAEGILPATVSGRCAAEAILAGDPASYPARLRAHPVLADYRRVHALLEAGRRLRDRAPGAAAEGTAAPRAPSSLAAALRRGATARGFAWMFSGRRLPMPRVLDWLVPRIGGRPSAPT